LANFRKITKLTVSCEFFFTGIEDYIASRITTLNLITGYKITFGSIKNFYNIRELRISEKFAQSASVKEQESSVPLKVRKRSKAYQEAEKGFDLSKIQHLKHIDISNLYVPNFKKFYQTLEYYRAVYDYDVNFQCKNLTNMLDAAVLINSLIIEYLVFKTDEEAIRQLEELFDDGKYILDEFLIQNIP
jgi:hypothetical protein